MDKIKEIFNFDNIGGKIKGLAKWSCWITILLLWIATPILIIVAIAEGGDDAFVAVILFLIAAVIASVVIWVGSWITYALGQYVEDIHAIRNKEVPLIKGTTTTLPPQKDIFAKKKADTSANTVKRCPYCGDVVKLGRCEMCGKEVK